MRITAGHRSVKVFMAGKPNRLDDLALLRVMAVARAEGALVTAHAENWGIRQFMSGHPTAGGFRHPQCRPGLQ